MYYMNENVCYLCGSNDRSTIYCGSNDAFKVREEHLEARKGAITQEFSYNWVRCQKCGLVYATSVPKRKVLERLYAASDQGDYGDEEGNLAFTYGKYLKKYESLITRKNKALDIGAGTGFFLRVLMENGFKSVTGIEPSVSACSAAKDDVKPLLQNRSFDVKNYDPGTFDFISCFQTLEHMNDVNEFMGDLFSLLSPGGILYCVCHNFASLGVKLLGRRHPAINVAHLVLFDRSTLSKMVSQHLEVLATFNVRNRYSLAYLNSLLPIEVIKLGVDWCLRTLGLSRVP